MRFRPPLTPSARARCSSAKQPYASERAALEAKIRAEEMNSVRLGVYQCAECLQWHFTSKVAE